MLNACVTGILPRFRYVLLTDALIETMTPVEVAAVFGHEIGHIAHRHLLYFGFFFAGSLGILTLLADGLGRGVRMGGERAGLSLLDLAAGRRAGAGRGRARRCWACTSGWSSATSRDASSARPTSSAAGSSRARPGTVRPTSTPTATLRRNRPAAQVAAAALPRGPPDVLRGPGDRGPVQRHGLARPILAARQHRQPDRIPGTSGTPSRRSSVDFQRRGRPDAPGPRHRHGRWRLIAAAHPAGRRRVRRVSANGSLRSRRSLV